MPGWVKHKLESRLPGEISITSDVQMTNTYGRKLRGTKEPLDENERGQLKSWFKTQHSKNEGHGILFHQFKVNRWGNNGNSDRLILGVSKITANIDCSLLFGRKAMTNLGIILKNRDITLPTNVHLVKAMVFSVVIYGCEN